MVVVLVPGYGGRVRAVERWRVDLAVRTLQAQGGGRLVLSGQDGEAERLARLVPSGIQVDVETTARSTLENVERSLPLLVGEELIAIASDRLHARRAVGHLRRVRPDLAERIVDPSRTWWRGWCIKTGSTIYEVAIAARCLWGRRRYRA